MTILLMGQEAHMSHSQATVHIPTPSVSQCNFITIDFFQFLLAKHDVFAAEHDSSSTFFPKP